MGFLSKLIYPAFGIAVLLSYGYVVRNAIEPFQVSSEKREIPKGATKKSSSSYRRSRGVYFFGGFGGK